MPKTRFEKGYELVREGLAAARFGAAVSGVVLAGVEKPLSLAVGEPGEDGNYGYNIEEYLARPWRILSAAMTPYRLFDFTKEGVLKSSVKAFADLTLYANHNANVNDWKGFVRNPTWDEANTPPGINALFVIDKVVDPKLARGVETKALRSASVTIWFEYERSHPTLSNFYDRLGEEVDGQIVRFIVTKIVNAGEVSIVWEGEDPYAKSLAAGGAPPAHETGLEVPDNNGGTDMFKLTATLSVLLSMAEGTELTPEALEAKLKEQKAALDALQADAALGKQLLTETRTKAETLYKLAKGDKASPDYLKIIQGADLASARAIVLEYTTAAEEAIPLACPKCGEKLSRQSSGPEGGEKFTAGGENIEDYKFA